MDEEEELENTLIGQEEEAPAIDTVDALMGGLGLGGAAFAAQTGRAPTPTPQGPLSPLAQQVANNDAARQAAARAASSASQPLGNLPRIGTLNPATGPSGGTTLPSQPSLQEARQAAARSAGVSPLSASRLARFGGPGSLIYGAADLGLEALTDRGLSERIGEGVGEAVGNLLFPGAQSQPAFTEAETLQDLAAMSSSEIQTPSVAPSNALLEMLERADEREAQGLPRQAAPGIIDAPVESLAAVATDQPQAAVSPFLQSPDTPSGLGGPLLRGFEMVNDAARGPNAPMGQDATRARLGGMTLNEYLNAPAGTPGVSGLRTDPQGRMITPSAQPPVDSAVPAAVAQPPVDALSSFERDSLARQQRIGGTGSFAGDSAAREARLRANERQPGESQAAADTRVAQSRTTGGQTEGLSFDDARRRAEGQLAARGVRNPSASQVNALARGIQAAEPERLAELATQRAKDAADLKKSELAASFEPKELDIGGNKYIQYTPTYIQPVIEDTPEKTGLQSTLENLQSDLTSGRLTQEEYDIAVRTATNAYIGREKPKGQTTDNEFNLITKGVLAGDAPTGDATDAPQVETGRGQARRGRPIETDGSTSQAPVTINSQAEYDALPAGTPYIDSQGTPGTKK